MIEELLGSIERATKFKEQHQKNRDNASGPVEEMAEARMVVYYEGKIEAYKEVLKYIEDAQRASVGE